MLPVTFSRGIALQLHLLHFRRDRFNGGTMTKRILSVAALVLSLFSTTSFAEKKSCEDLKTEIAAKLDAKGVKNYELKIVAAEEVKSETIVGSCDGGTKRITYTRK